MSVTNLESRGHNGRTADPARLTEWLEGSVPTGDALRAVEDLVRPTLDLIRERQAALPGDFDVRVRLHTARNIAFTKRMMTGDARRENVPIRVENGEALKAACAGPGGALVIMSHAGMWNAMILHAATLPAPFTFLIEDLDEAAVDFYRSYGAEPIIARPDLSFRMTDGGRFEIPGTSPMAQVKRALCHGYAVGMFGDSYRTNGVKTNLMGVPVSLINHYAVVAVQVACTVLILDQWYSEDAIHLRFDSVNTHPDEGSKRLRAARIVEQYIAALKRHFDRSPEQYAYVMPNVFGLSHGLRAHRSRAF